MKLKTFGLLIICSLLLLTFSCSPDDAPGNGVSTGNCTIECEVNGSEIDASPAVCAFIDNTLNLGLIGMDNIQLQLNNLTAPGTFEFGTTDVIILIDDTGGGASEALGSSGTGSVIVTELNSNNARGTFSGTFFRITDFDMSEPFTITDGRFNANF